MLFNSFSFLVFLPIVFSLYWVLARRSIKLQNLLLLIASYYFYSCWSKKFLLLLIFSTALDYFSGLKIESAKSQHIRRIYLWISVGINLGLLCVLKYFNFFADSFSDFASTLGFNVDAVTLNVILPVGISFYTFHGLSYILDIYNRKIKAERNVVEYSLFVSYFPLLVAGPIERATHLLPQLKVFRTVDYQKTVDGLRQILWGLFKKMVIADNCAPIVNDIFENYHSESGITLAIGAILFAFQIYGDFSGYSDIALGTSRLFGIELLRNFNYPYFSRNIAEFWRRWHISLSSWFRDYVYVPLGGSRKGLNKTILNVLIIFLLSGFWHGANWTFIFWGLLNAVFILPSVISNTNRKYTDPKSNGSVSPSLKEIHQILATFLVACFAWIFFRSPTIKDAFSYSQRLFDVSNYTIPFINTRNFILLFFILFMIVFEWIQRDKLHALSFKPLNWTRRGVAWSGYLLIAFCILFFTTSSKEFIYFQF